MKVKITRNDYKQFEGRTIRVGYCDMYYTMKALGEPSYYTCGVYGWNCDVYKTDEGYYISTGYRPFGKIKVDFNAMRKTEARMRGFYENMWREYIKGKFSYETMLRTIHNKANQEIIKLINKK